MTEAMQSAAAISQSQVIVGLEIAAQVLEMRLQTIKDAPLPVPASTTSEICKRRAINEMAQAIEHVRNFIVMPELLADGIKIAVENGNASAISDEQNPKSDLETTQRALLWFVDGAPGLNTMSTREYEALMSENEAAIAKARAAAKST